jgi:excisionase family DNA binding protein
MAKRVDHRRVKVHLTLTMEEWAERLGVHKRTIIRWVKQEGLEAIADKRPWLIRGSDLKAFLDDRASRRKRPCKTGEMYCFTCRSPREPAGGMLDYVPQTALSGLVMALCPSLAFAHRVLLSRPALPESPSTFAGQVHSHPQGEKEDQGTDHPSAPLAQSEQSGLTSNNQSQTLLTVTASGVPNYLTTDSHSLSAELSKRGRNGTQEQLFR